MHILDEYALKMGVKQKDSSIIWSAIVVQEVMNYTCRPLHFKNVK